MRNTHSHNYRLFVFFLLAILPFRPVALAQSVQSGIGSALESMFENMALSSSRVPTGYLLDRAVEFTDISLYNGASLTADNYSDITIYRNAVFAMNSARVNSAAVAYDADLVTDSLADTSAVNLGIALFNYNYIVSNALTDNLISYQNGKVYDVISGGVLLNPFSTSRLFIFAPSRPLITDTQVRYKFSLSNIVGNLSPTLIEFDAGNGSGYQTIGNTFNSVISYSSVGEKELKMRVTLSGGITLEAHSKIELLSPPIATASSFPAVTPTGTFTKTYNNVSARVTYVAMGSGSIKKPLIFVEGFDIDWINFFADVGEYYVQNYYKLMFSRIFDMLFFSALDGVITLVENSSSFDDFYEFYYHTSSVRGFYDIFYVDWNNHEADIRDNAQLLVMILDEINGMKDASAGRNTVVGHSMGGLIARYALRTMETQGHPHQTDYYVSLDAPHLGVNVPLGLQYAVVDLLDVFCDGSHIIGNDIASHLFNPLLTRLVELLNSPSATQMMYYYVSPNGVTQDKHYCWRAELNQLGFPQGDFGYPIENYSIVNGGRYNGNLSDELFSLTSAVGGVPSGPDAWTYITNVLARMLNLNMTLQVKRDDGSGGPISILGCSYRKKLEWLATLGIENALSYTRYSPSLSKCLDSLRNSSLIQADSISTLLYTYYSPVFFVPTASAIAVDDFSVDFYNNLPEPKSETPFDSYLLNGTALEHSNFDYNHYVWVATESSIKMSTVSGREALVQNGEKFIVNDIGGFVYPTWTTSDPTIATISSSGILSTHGSGLVTVKYSSKSTGQKHIKTKKVLVGGVPSDFHLSYVKSGNNYTFTASCSDSSVNSFLEECATSGKLDIMWGVKVGTNPIQWYRRNTLSFSTVITTTTNVYFKLVDPVNNDQYVELHSRVLVLIPVANYDPQIIYTMYGNAYMYYSTIDDSGLFEPYFFVWDKPITPYSPSPDRIIINNQIIMRNIMMTETVNGEPKTVYCFKLLDNTYIQSVISNINSYPNHTAILSGMICNGNTWLDDFTLTITKGYPPINL